jgi:hypothetical protein
MEDAFVVRVLNWRPRRMIRWWIEDRSVVGRMRRRERPEEKFDESSWSL